MRQIIFRGKREDNGKWVEGDLWQCTPDLFQINHMGVWYRVDPKTVGQFSGLYDTQEMMIWEDDLVRMDQWNPKIMRIAFGEGAFFLADTDGKYLADIHYASGECLVTGSIYENPELLCS